RPRSTAPRLHRSYRSEANRLGERKRRSRRGPRWDPDRVTAAPARNSKGWRWPARRRDLQEPRSGGPPWARGPGATVRNLRPRTRSRTSNATHATHSTLPVTGWLATLACAPPPAKARVPQTKPQSKLVARGSRHRRAETPQPQRRAAHCAHTQTRD